MPGSFNRLANAFRVLPNPRPITWTPQNPTGAAVTISVSQRRPWTQEEIAQLSDGVRIAAELAAFLLPVILLGGGNPKNGDKLTDGDATWTIVSLRGELENTLLRCLTIRDV